VVQLRPMPAEVLSDLAALTGCVAGAATVDELTALLHQAGFVDVLIDVKPESSAFIRDWLPGSGIEELIAAATLQARRPESVGACCGATCCTPSAEPAS
jgi:arsenite methyltransferase